MVMNEMILIDLPLLQSFQLGGGALFGKGDDESCSLIMRSNNKIE